MVYSLNMVSADHGASSLLLPNPVEANFQFSK